MRPVFSPTVLRPVAIVLATLLAACSQPSPPASQGTRTPPPTYDIVASIRAAGDREKSAIEVAPLSDPGVTALQHAAQADERAQRYDDAAGKLDQALKLAGDAPAILQDRAEIYVRQRDFANAEKFARKSFALGSQLGSLCARNWQTVVEMRLQADDAAGATSARAELAKCHQGGPVRM
jgi:tetratricopeptide (TPR) repeat protein